MARRRVLLWLATGLWAAAGWGCPSGCEKGSPRPAAGSPPPTFADITQTAGIRFSHHHGGAGEKYFPETMGSGAVLFDCDGDGNLDLYFVQSGKLPWRAGQELRNVLYRNDGGTFVDISEASGLADDGYGMGAAAGDFDNDGDLDIFITNFGPDRLYRNRGDGTFEDVTEKAGVGADAWGTSGAFADYDGDGRLDLYVSNYLDFTFATHKWCGRREPGYQVYCNPDEYDGVDDLL